MDRNLPSDPIRDDPPLRLSDYLDGTLAPDAQAEVEAALARDPALRDELAALRRVDGLVRAQGAAVPDVDWERFSEESRRRRAGQAPAASIAPRPPLLLRLFKPLAAAAVVMFVVTTGLLLRKEMRSVESSTEAAAPVVVVTLGRPQATGVAIVEVSHTVPQDALVTVGPAPRAHTMIVTVGGGTDDWREPADDDEAVYF